MGLPAIATRSPSRPLAAALLASAVALHNLEEGLTYSITRPLVGRVAADAGVDLTLPSPAMFQSALGLVTFVALALLAWAARSDGNDDRAWTVLRVIAAVLLVNVAVPHVPAAIWLGGYAPGVVTAVLINLPLAAWILLRGRPA